MTVAESSNLTNKGVKGIVVNETQKMIWGSTQKGVKKMIKRENTFEFEKKGKCCLIDGKLLEKRPEERIT